MSARLPKVNGSTSWEYILEGVGFALVHPELWRHVFLPLCCSIIVGVVALGVLFGLVLTPQVHLLANHMPQWVAWIVSILLIFVEAGFVVGLLTLILFESYEDKLVVHTMRLRGVELPDKGGAWGTTKQLLFALVRIILQAILFFVSLPIHAIPVVGTALYCALNGWMLGWSLHAKYFELKDFTLMQQITMIKNNFMDYTLLGGAATFLNLIPVVGLIFYWTSVVGASLWAADIELAEMEAGETLGGVDRQESSRPFINLQPVQVQQEPQPYRTLQEPYSQPNYFVKPKAERSIDLEQGL